MNTPIFCLIIVATLTYQGCLGQNQQESEVYGQPLLVNLLENFRNKANVLRDETIHNVSSISKNIVHQVYDKLREAHGQIKTLSQTAVKIVKTNVDKIKHSTELKLQEAERAKEVEFETFMNSLKDKSVRELNGVVATSYSKLENKSTNLMSLLDQKSNSVNQNLRQVLKDTYKTESEKQWKAIKSSSMKEMKLEVDQEVKSQVNSFLDQQFEFKRNNYSLQLLNLERYYFSDFENQLRNKVRAEIQKATIEIDSKLNEYSNRIQGLKDNLDHSIAGIHNIDANRGIDRGTSKKPDPNLVNNPYGDSNRGTNYAPSKPPHVDPNLVNNPYENSNRGTNYAPSEHPYVDPNLVNNPYENSNRGTNYAPSEHPYVDPNLVNNPYGDSNRGTNYAPSKPPHVDPNLVNNPYENSNRGIGRETSEEPEIDPRLVDNSDENSDRGTDYAPTEHPYVDPNLVNNPHENSNRGTNYAPSEHPHVDPDLVNNPYENSNRGTNYAPSEHPHVDPDLVNNPYENSNRGTNYAPSEHPHVDPDLVNNPYENSNGGTNYAPSKPPHVDPDLVNNPHENSNRGTNYAPSEHPYVDPNLVNNPHENSNRGTDYAPTEHPYVDTDPEQNLPHGNNDDDLKINEDDSSLDDSDLDKIFDEFRLPDVMV